MSVASGLWDTSKRWRDWAVLVGMVKHMFWVGCGGKLQFAL